MPHSARIKAQPNHPVFKSLFGKQYLWQYEAPTPSTVPVALGVQRILKSINLTDRLWFIVRV